MRTRTLVWAVTFVVVCGTVTTLLKTVERTLFRSGSSAQHTVDSTDPFQQSNSPSALAPKPPVASATDQHWAATKLLSEANVAHREALSCIERWQAEIEPLANDERGDAIAANQDLVARLAVVFKKKHRLMSDSEIRAAGEQLALFQKRVEAVAAESPPELLSPREMYEIRELHGGARLAQRDWEEVFNQAHAIALQADRDVNPIAEPTLRQSLEQLEAEQTIQQLDKNIDSDEPSGRFDDPNMEQFLDHENQELRNQALAPEVMSSLAPFLEPRYIQPSLAGSFSIRFSRTADRMPMSLGKLMSIGALNETEMGLKKLALIGGNRKLPEPKWSIAAQPCSWDDGDEEFLRQSQQMLRDYGPILVAEGLLSR